MFPIDLLSLTLNPVWNWSSHPDDTPETLALKWKVLGQNIAITSASSWVWHCGQGPTVLCLHGVPCSSFGYRRLLPALAAAGLHAVALDFPGMGWADRLQEYFDYSWSGLASWLLHALDALNLYNLHLLAHDTSGPIVFELLRLCPERIASVSFMSCMFATASYRRPWFMQPLAWKNIGPLYLGHFKPSWFSRLYRRAAIFAPMPDNEILTHWHLMTHQDQGKAFLAIMRGFEYAKVFEQRARTTLQGSPIPMQILWGHHDKALPPNRFIHDAIRMLNRNDVHYFEAGHSVQEDSPEALANQMKSFILRSSTS